MAEVESWNMRGDLEKLVENMSEIKAVVLDAEEQQSTNNHQVQLWLEKLKDALDDADDLLDDFNTEELRRQVMTNHKKAKKLMKGGNMLTKKPVMSLLALNWILPGKFQLLFSMLTN
ncbi:hypothetical protein P8452_30354 [Trifolium repens]|nr:hypothetical protein P8452_30354 [Trifolium repens]